MRVTSVLGHIKTYEFPDSCKNWKGTPYTTLYTIPLKKHVVESSKLIVKNIELAIKDSFALILWLDCDREGEAIAYDVIDICQSFMGKLEIYRAHFSTVTNADIQQAYNNVTAPNKNLADAVMIRQEVDLRIGASFTRFQTLLIQEMYPKKYGVISYGPCQFPTLGFIVERHLLIKEFIPETFFYLDCKDERENQGNKLPVKFEWKRGRIFDELTTFIIYEMCVEAGKAKVTKVTKKDTIRRRPYPLNTVALQKTASIKLRMTAHRIMEIAEKLYNKGLISYPRTETAKYSHNINIKNLIKRQVESNIWGDFSKRLIDDTNGLYQGPMCGKGDDKAHPPIHPDRKSVV